MKPIGLNDRIIVKQFKEKNKRSNVIIPDKKQEKPMEGEVISVGAGRISQTTLEVKPLTVKVGDIVSFSKYNTVMFIVDDEEYISMKEDEVLAILTEDK